MNLAEAQAALFALTWGEPRSPDQTFLRVGGPPGVTAEDRLEIYRRANVNRISESLRLWFDRTARLMGGGPFIDAVMEYVERPQPVRLTGRRLARGFPAFLRLRPGSRRVDLADLAELELARIEVAEEADAQALGPGALARLDLDGLAAMRLRFVPALRLLHLGYDVFDLWQALEAGQEPPEPRAVASRLVVWRQGRTLLHSPLDPLEAEALERAMRGSPLHQVCEAFGEDEAAADNAYAALKAWLDDGLVAGAGDTEA